MAPNVSIVMRSKNDIEYIEQTLKMLYRQEYKDFELISVDSGSTDGTFEIIKKYNNDTVYRIKPEDYIPGKVLNEAIKKCRGDIVVFNNSDCIPQNEQWLGNLLKPFDNSNIGAVYGRQIPRPSAHPLVIKDYERAFDDGSISLKWFHFFSLATSAIRKELLEKWPFDETIKYSEDIEWSYRAKNNNIDIAYANDAIVEHSHNYTLKEVYKRFYGEGVAEGQIYNRNGFATSFLMMVVKALIAEVLRDCVYLIGHKRLGVIFYSFVYRGIQKYAVYRGNRDFLKTAK